MARLDADNLVIAAEIIGRYPRPKSALIPLLHLAQEQDGWVTTDAMAHIAELVGVTPAEVLGTCSFYEMFKREPVGRYLVNVCTNISCQLMGGEELLHHAEQTLGVKAGNTTADGMFTVEDVECIAACTEAPCLQVNYRYRHRITNDEFDRMVDDLRAGRLDDEVPPHGTLARVRQSIPADRAAGPASPEGGSEPVWMGMNAPPPSADGADGSGRLMAITDAPKIITGRFGYDDSLHAGPLRGHRRLRRPAQGADHVARGGGRRGEGGQPAGPGRRRLPRRGQVGLLPARRVAALPGGQRRRERARHLQGPHAHGARSPPAHRGHPHRLLRGGLRPGLPVRAGRDGPGPGAHRRRPQRGLRRRIRRDATSAAPTSRWTWS